MSHLSRQRKGSDMLCAGAHKSVLLISFMDQHQERTWATAETQSRHCCSSPGSAWETLALHGHQVKSGP